MSDNLNKAIALLNSDSSFRCAIVKDDTVYTSVDRGVKPLIGFIDSGIGAKYNGRFFGSDEICPADDMPWSHYSVYLMHKNKQTIMVAQYYEEAERAAADRTDRIAAG